MKKYYYYVPTEERTMYCQFCKKEFLSRYAQKKYCSKKCCRLNEYKPIYKKRICQICLKETQGGYKFCQDHKSGGKKTKQCLLCSLDITETKNKKYCDNCSISLLKNHSTFYRHFSKKIIKEWKTEGRVCVWCRSPEITIDHIIPLTKGGELLNPSNLQPLCKLCNTSKGNKMFPYIECERYFTYVLSKKQS